jgi:hypothetical protein
MKFINIILKNQLLPQRKHVSITRISWLMLFTEIIDIYSENHIKIINTLCGQSEELVNVKTCGIYGYQFALKG